MNWILALNNPYEVDISLHKQNKTKPFPSTITIMLNMLDEYEFTQSLCHKYKRNIIKDNV